MGKKPEPTPDCKYFSPLGGVNIRDMARDLEGGLARLKNLEFLLDGWILRMNEEIKQRSLLMAITIEMNDKVDRLIEEHYWLKTKEEEKAGKPKMYCTCDSCREKTKEEEDVRSRLFNTGF